MLEVTVYTRADAVCSVYCETVYVWCHTVIGL